MACFGVSVCHSIICRFYTGLFFVVKIRIAVFYSDDFLQTQFVSEVSIYEPKMLIFMDETGYDQPLGNMAIAYEGSHTCLMNCWSEVREYQQLTSCLCQTAKLLGIVLMEKCFINLSNSLYDIQ